MIRTGAPGAVLLVGPAGIGKSTLAVDLAAGLLCTAPDAVMRPCGACRSCRLALARHHPDVHVLGPDGPGRQVVIGGAGSKARGIRDLIGELALLPVEGGVRVAIIENADRMNEDAQAALLKTLEEPPPDATIVLCADAEETVLPTIRSRCARIRLGQVGVREIEALLVERGVAEAPLAGRVARISGGRPGVAIAWAAAPDALIERDAITRTLLDLTSSRPADRLTGIRAMAPAAGSIAAAISAPTAPSASNDGVAPRSGARRAGRGSVSKTDLIDEPSADEGVDDAGPTRVPATERRRAAEALIGLWTEVARDVALCQRGHEGSVRDVGALDDLRVVARRLEEADVTAFLERLGRAAVLISANVSPDTILDDLAIAWPYGTRRAA